MKIKERRKFATQCFDHVTRQTGSFFYNVEKYEKGEGFHSIDGKCFPDLCHLFTYAHSIGFHLDPLSVNEMEKRTIP